MKETVLVIEDRAGHARDIIEVLKRAHVRVECVEAGAEALALARSAAPALIVADISLERGDCLKTAETLGWVDGIPCILVVGLPCLVTDHLMATMGFLKCVLWRPFSEDSLIRGVESVVGSLATQDQGS